MYVTCVFSENDLLTTCYWRIMVLNATFNNISVISWQSVLLVEDNHRPVVSLSQLLVVIGTDCVCSYKFNYHTITMAPRQLVIQYKI